MLDRESTFADPDIIQLLQNELVPVAIDQAYQRRQKDAEGDFYRKIAGKGPRGDGSNGGTTQGLYIAAPDGTYLGYSNHRSPERIKQLIRKGLSGTASGNTSLIEQGKKDLRYSPIPPTGGLTVRVQAKVLGGYPATEDQWKKIFQTSLSRDNLWLTALEHQAILKGTIPNRVQRRIARFHLVDNTRGEPPMWKEDEIEKIEMEIKNGVLTGFARLKTGNGSRGYDCQFYGVVESEDGQMTRFDIVAKGDFWGNGPYTKGAPKGKFPLGISFRLADGSDVADGIPPQGSRGWIQGYLR